MFCSNNEDENVTSFDSDATYCSDYESRIQDINLIEKAVRNTRNHQSLLKPLKRLKIKKSNNFPKIYPRRNVLSLLQEVERRIKIHFEGSHLMSTSEIIELLGSLHRINVDGNSQYYKNNLVNMLTKLHKINRTFEEKESLRIKDPMENISIPVVMQYKSDNANEMMIKIPDNTKDNTVGTVDLLFLTNQDFESELDHLSKCGEAQLFNNVKGQLIGENATGCEFPEKAVTEKSDTELNNFTKRRSQNIDSHGSDTDSPQPKKKILENDRESEGSNGYLVKNISPENVELAKIFEKILHIDSKFSKNFDSVQSVNLKNVDTGAENVPVEEVKDVKSSFIKSYNETMDKLCSDITTGRKTWVQTYDIFNDIANMFSEGNELLSKICYNLKDSPDSEQLNIETVIKYHVERFGPENADDIRDLLNSNLARMEEIAEEFKNDPLVRELFEPQEKANAEDFLLDWRNIAHM